MIGRVQRYLMKPLINPGKRWLSAAETKLVKLTVDGKEIEVPAGTLLVDAIRQNGIDVPTMCYHTDLRYSGGICRICLVDDLSRPGATPIISCRTPVQEGMKIGTTSAKLFEMRQANTALMFRTHPTSCLTCSSNTKCETQNQAGKMNIFGDKKKEIMYQPSYNPTVDHTTVLNRNMDLCIGCDRCIQACRTQCNVYEWYHKDYHAVETLGDMFTNECICCGQCINRCPTGALTERPEISQVMSAIRDPTKEVVFQIAPAIRASIAEEFGCKPGERILKNELVTALKAMGPNVTVLDTDFAADLTIMEEASEFVERLTRKFTGKKYLSPEEHYSTDIPMFTSCCPGWVTFMEKNYPQLLNHMSSCKSPMQMQSALIKTFWAEKVKKVDPKNVVVVSIMPCAAKKMEKERPDMRTKDFKWTDYILTNRETAKIMKQAGQDPTKLPKTDFDKTMGVSSGAGVIFGATGGVLEAALRTGYEVITGKPVPFPNLDITPVRGMEGVREAKIKIEGVKPEFSFLEGFELRVAVAHGIGNARSVVEIVKEAKEKGLEPPWHLIEVMACPGGCLGGGGQPKPTSLPIRKERAKLIYEEDKNLPIRKSHENPEIKDMYKNYLEHPLSEVAHHLLHRSYTPFTNKYISKFDPEEAKGIESILNKYPKKSVEHLLPLVIDETDRKGYLSMASMGKIANHLGVNPGKIASVLTHYHYFPKDNKADTQIYVCMCHNCRMRGQNENYKILESLQADYKYGLHRMNWLGVCVNDAPAAMVKRAGTDYVEYLMGLSGSKLKKKVKKLNKYLLKTPPSNIKLFPFKRMTQGLPQSSMLEPLPEGMIDDILNAGKNMSGDEIISRLKNAKLQGRGGAGFPTHIKWDSVRKIDNNQKKYIVCNADEGLPSTFKDWWILNNEDGRSRMIAGMCLCAKTVGAKNAYVYLRYEYRNLVPELKKTIANIKSKHPEFSEVVFEIRLGGGPYVAGEETAQFESIMGNSPVPRKDRPFNVFATMQGLFNGPTVINNVETYFAVPYILHHSEETISKYGLPKIFGVTGDIPQPTLLEYPLNTPSPITLQSILDEIQAKNIAAIECGGTTEPLLLQKDFSRRVGFGSGLANAVGSIVLFNNSRNLRQVYVDKLEFMADESCKQCVPCREGSLVLKNALHHLAQTGKQNISNETLKQIAEVTALTSICAHGKAIGPLFQAAIDFFNSH